MMEGEEMFADESDRFSGDTGTMDEGAAAWGLADPDDSSDLMKRHYEFGYDSDSKEGWQAIFDVAAPSSTSDSHDGDWSTLRQDSPPVGVWGTTDAGDTDVLDREFDFGHAFDHYSQSTSASSSSGSSDYQNFSRYYDISYGETDKSSNSTATIASEVGAAAAASPRSKTALPRSNAATLKSAKSCIVRKKRTSAAKVKKEERTRRAKKDLLQNWIVVHDLLTGRVSNPYPVRPHFVQARAVQQIFFERPPQRRANGDGRDRWRNSGGTVGSTITWVNNSEGVRKRYGQLRRADPTLKKLGFLQYSLVYRDPRNPEQIEEDKSAYLFAIEPCEFDDAETHKPPSLRPQIDLSTLREMCAASTASTSASERGALEPPARVAVLDFDLAKIRRDAQQAPAKGARRGSTPIKRERKRRSRQIDGTANDDLLSKFKFDGGDLRPKRLKQNGPGGWPFGQATFVKATLLSLAVIAMSGYMMATGWRLLTMPSETSLCSGYSFRPLLSMQAECTQCRDCLSEGFETLVECSASANAQCGKWTWSKTTSVINTSSANSFSESSARPVGEATAWYNEHSAVDPPNAAHLPQFSVTWRAGAELAVYSFGGASSIDTTELSNEQRASGEQCITQAIGVSDELWRFSPASGWQPVSNTVASDGKTPRLWPRGRYASIGWGLGSGTGQSLVFSGAFEFCYRRDYLRDSETPENTDQFLAPDSLYLFTPASHGNPATWTLLGGSDNWNRIGIMDTAQALQSGYANSYSCGMPDAHDELQECAWPLPRSHSQGWTLSGKVYLFSGLFNTVDQSFEIARRRSTMLNDLWQINVQSSMSDIYKSYVMIKRVAACSTAIEDTAVLPFGGVYPGPRFSAATWDVPAKNGEAGWLFGGVGRAVSDRVSNDDAPEGGWPEISSVCNTDEIKGGMEAVGNLCDLWVFAPGVGFRLVQACGVDAPVLRAFVMPDVAVSPQSAAPSAAIFAATWVQHDASQTLWLFGGLTSCDSFDGIGPDGTVMPEWLQSKTDQSWSSLLENMTMCDLVMRGPAATDTLPGSDEWYYPLAAFPDNHINQPCTSDMWRFDLVSETWDHVLSPPSTRVPNASSALPVVAWPEPRCGAVVLSYRTEAEESPYGDSDNNGNGSGPAQYIVGGWSGSASGECEEWPSISNITDDCQWAGKASGLDDVCPLLNKGFLSSDMPTHAANAQRTHEAQCRPMTETWQFGLQRAP